MDNVTRRKYTNRKENKENAQPKHEIKSIKREFPKTTTSAGLLQVKRNEKEQTLGKSGPLKASAKPAYTRSASGDILKKVKSVQRDMKGVAVAAAAGGDAKQRQTHSRVFLSDQAVKHKKIAAEAPKPPAPVQSTKPAPGTYKGKVVQSKIGSIWKASAKAGGADPKPPAPKPESQRVGHFTKSRSKSVVELQGRRAPKPAPSRSKSVSDELAQASKPTVTSRPPTAFRSARPPVRTVPATLTSTSSRNTTAALTKASGTQSSKPKIPVTDKKVNKPPVTSTLSQYRYSMETVEERRAKLADWLASKGKTLKRPAVTAAASSKTKVSAPAELKPQSHPHVEPQPVAQCDPEPEPRLEAQKPDSPAAALCADILGAGLTTHSLTPVIMNTTLDLLENSDADLPVDPQDRVDDIVVNLCYALDAMETPSRCSDDLSQVTDECSNVEMEDGKLKDECEKVELKGETSEAVSEQPKDEQVRDGAEENDEQKVETDDGEEVESDDYEDDDDEMENMPQMEDASVVKYSVKTTPYLQSVKKTIEGDVGASGSRRKSNIKDLKFLTPVRRSNRIQRKSSRLPSMLVDHDLCVSSLAELVKMDDDPNAYIYRKNPALLDDLPDQPRL
ncbi:cytoskeleton-associated protein 2 [Scomber scombrus]|uniref:cytoskeleton-associated protein 2 n=1 Tax=Scomber scombrus TaxID=13677 RepID=UPI002DDB159A|nr:cytoskeleton-associated protein 2 [Scomber scombrus]XP_062289215.1 cytoskeleton-associated protein 2 [Scomber scombrus]